MKKSYHSTVVPTTVAKTTRRLSTGAAMVPVGVKPADPGDEALMFLTPVSFRRHCQASRFQRWLAEVRAIIYDFRYDARARELMTEHHTEADAVRHRAAGDAADPRFAALPGRPGKIIAIHL